MYKIGDKVRFLKYQNDKQWEKSYGGIIGVVATVCKGIFPEDKKSIKLHVDGNPFGFYVDPSQVEFIFENREFLRDFVALNNIKTTLVSKQLGKSKGWLTQVMNRTDRGDLTDEELQDILKKLHVDWTQETFVHVKATKTHSAYRTRPCVYEHAKHKELLQRAFWDGLFVGLKA